MSLACKWYLYSGWAISRIDHRVTRVVPSFIKSERSIRLNATASAIVALIPYVNRGVRDRAVRVVDSDIDRPRSMGSGKP